MANLVWGESFDLRGPALLPLWLRVVSLLARAFFSAGRGSGLFGLELAGVIVGVAFIVAGFGLEQDAILRGAVAVLGGFFEGGVFVGIEVFFCFAFHPLVVDAFETRPGFVAGIISRLAPSVVIGHGRRVSRFALAGAVSKAGSQPGRG